MPTPTVVQRQADAADAIIQSLTAPVVVSNPEPVAANEPAPAPAPTTSEETWEQRYRTLQGMFNQEKQNTSAAQREVLSELARMRAELEAVRAAPTSAEPAKPAMDPEDVERFGADLVEMVQRGAAATIAAVSDKFTNAVTKLETRISALESTVTGVSKQAELSREEQFYATLSKLVPDWEEVNADNGFLAWLAEKDPVYGVERQVGLSAAHQALRADHAANVFNAYKAIRKAKPTAEPLVAPRSTSTATSIAAPEAPVFVSQKEINDFYHDVTRGRYVGREAEAARREAEIATAVAEGRVK